MSPKPIGMYCMICDQFDCSHVTNPEWLAARIAMSMAFIRDAKKQLIRLKGKTA